MLYLGVGVQITSEKLWGAHVARAPAFVKLGLRYDNFLSSVLEAGCEAPLLALLLVCVSPLATGDVAASVGESRDDSKAIPGGPVPSTL